MKFVRSGSAAFVLPLLMTLAACGGGSSSSDTAATSPAATSTPAPTAVSQSPAPTTGGASSATSTTSASTVTSRSLGVMDLTAFGPGGVLLKSASGTGVDISLASKGSVDILVNGVALRQITTTYRVRNAVYCATPGTCPAFTTALKNLRLVAVSTSETMSSTAVSRLKRFDGSAASSAIAAQITPSTGVDGLGRVLSLAESSVVQYAAGEAPPPQPGVTQVLNYGFAVVRSDDPANRVLSANPAAGQYDGLLKLTIAVPVQAQAGADPFEIGMVFELVADPD